MSMLRSLPLGVSMVTGAPEVVIIGSFRFLMAASTGVMSFTRRATRAAPGSVCFGTPGWRSTPENSVSSNPKPALGRRSVANRSETPGELVNAGTPIGKRARLGVQAEYFAIERERRLQFVNGVD